MYDRCPFYCRAQRVVTSALYRGTGAGGIGIEADAGAGAAAAAAVDATMRNVRPAPKPNIECCALLCLSILIT